MDAVCNTETKFALGIMDEVREDDDLFDSPTSSDSHSTCSNTSSGSDSMEDASSSPPNSSSPSKISLSSTQLGGGPLYEMSNLMAQLPFKRGLSKHYDGKSQSFASLAEVSCLADIPKPENPYSRRLKASRSYGGNLDCHRSYPPRSSISKAISKKSSPRSSCAASLIRRYSFICSKPPIPTQKHV